MRRGERGRDFDGGRGRQKKKKKKKKRGGGKGGRLRVSLSLCVSVSIISSFIRLSFLYRLLVNLVCRAAFVVESLCRALREERARKEGRKGEARGDRDGLLYASDDGASSGQGEHLVVRLRIDEREARLGS